MATQKGNLSINSENIFPIIKKWLYSDHDIFIRELISNGVDAITKIKRLDSMGEAKIEDNPKFKVTVSSSPKEKTITFEDNGIGMTREEVEKYINEIAFSGASDFLEKYKDKDQSEQIIGHFGLGFYSAFMVADKVTIDTLSYKEDAEPVHWESDGGLTYEISKGNKDERGTVITLYLADDSLEFCNEFKVKEVINKYCSFMPVEIYYINEDKAKEEVDKEIEAKAKVIEAEKKAKKKAEEDDLVGDSDTSEAEAEEIEEVDAEDTEEEEEDENEPKPLNDIHPLWTKAPADCKDEDYIDFYQHVFLDFKKPLFWIHLNMDYPFNLKGILYFPRINPNMDKLEGTVKLYNNQVFVADNIKEVIPEFLLVLKGVIDCPDLPLNVSRSALQNDGFVAKISDYITKKVADKLIGMYKNHKEDYEGLWDDLSPFIKFGCLRDNKFDEKMKDYMIFKNLEEKYLTLPEYLEAAKEKHENTVYYISDAETQANYIQMFKDEGLDAIYLTHNIDNPYITMMEARDDKVKFMRIDSDVSASFKGEALSEEDEKKFTDALTETFKKALGKESIKLKVESLKDENVSSMLTQSEADRRMAEMMKMYADAGMGGMGGLDYGANAETLILNSNNKLVKYVLDNPEGDMTETICCQLYDLAVLANKPLTAEELTRFVARSNEILGKLI
ncbi:molecular chaperone HtpG [Lachnospiraceae bacterium]|nr:molecular chaperone HtpG [Lachnospiraceae bacterium]